MAENTEREEQARMLQYFWEEKGNIERWVGFDKAIASGAFPHVRDAWEDYLRARENMTAAVKDAVEKWRA
jgi:hypothetical protein